MKGTNFFSKSFPVNGYNFHWNKTVAIQLLHYFDVMFGNVLKHYMWGKYKGLTINNDKFVFTI